MFKSIRKKYHRLNFEIKFKLTGFFVWWFNLRWVISEDGSDSPGILFKFLWRYYVVEGYKHSDDFIVGRVEKPENYDEGTRFKSIPHKVDRDAPPTFFRIIQKRELDLHNPEINKYILGLPSPKTEPTISAFIKGKDPDASIEFTQSGYNIYATTKLTPKELYRSGLVEAVTYVPER